MRQMLSKWMLAPVIALLAMIAPAVSAAQETVDIPAYVIIVGQNPSEEEFVLPDSLFYEISGKTIFKVNKTILNQSDPFVVELAQRILPLANEKGWQLEAIELRGAASPEGPYWNNVRLSVGRAKALRDFMTSNLNNVNLGEYTTTNTIAEDYPYLLWLLERDGDFAAPYLREIMEKHGSNKPELIKRDLRALYGGRVWRRLLRDYFPRTRAAKVVLFFSRLYPEKVEIEVPELIDVLGKIPMDIKAPEMSYIRVPRLKTGLYERRHMFSIGTNILYDGFYMPHFGWAPMPNIQVEYYPPRGKFTFQASFMWPYYHKWDKHKFFQIRDYHLEARRYFNPGLHHTGPYVGLYFNNNIYGIGFGKTKGWEGEGLGGGVKLGWGVQLGNSRWRMDFHIAAGGYVTRYDPYVWGNPITGEEDGKYYYDYTGEVSRFKKRNHRLTWFGPTEVGVTLTYDVLFYRRFDKHASFLRYEPSLSVTQY